MSILKFENLNVTTMTCLLDISGTIYIENLFPLLEITRLDFPKNKRNTKKYKIPYPGPEFKGCILSARYKNVTRGLIKNINGKVFLNSITIDISTSMKNVNIKLSDKKLHLCGISDSSLAYETAGYLVQQLYKIQDTLDYLNSNPIRRRVIINWLKAKTKGSESLYTYSNENDELEQTMMTSLIIPEDILETIPTDLARFESDKVSLEEVVIFFLRQCPDFNIHEHYCRQLDWVESLEKVMERKEQIEVLNFSTVMVNYNYDLRFNINRNALYIAINDLNNEFIARYNNTLEHSVTVVLPYKITDNKMVKKKNKIPCHTFLVYKSGLVTQSGPNPELTRDAYYKFNHMISGLKNCIMNPGIRTIKYKAYSNSN